MQAMTPAPLARYLTAHWSGKLSFWQTFGANILVVRLAWLWAVPLALPGTLPAVAVVILIGLDLLCLIWQATGLIRYGDRSASSYGSVIPYWGALVALGVLLLASLALWWHLVLVSPLAPERQDRLLEPPEEQLELTVSADGRTLYLSGDIHLGVTAQLARVLGDHPGLATLDLDSGGGHIYAARGLAALVIETGLATRVESTCSSACILVFLAGSPRSLGDTARLGFHSYQVALPSGLPNVDPVQELRKDLGYFRQRGLSAAFVARIPDIPPDDMWFPTRQQLVAGGVVEN